MNYNILDFKTDGKNYLYSGNTGQIAEISQELKDLLNRDIRNDKIIKIQKTNPVIFSPSPVRIIKFGYSKDFIKEQIEHGLKQMTLGVTNQCNLRCKYCVYSGNFKNFRTHSNKCMSLEIAVKSIDYFLKHLSKTENSKFLTFYGGEPLLNFDLISQVINYVKSKSNANIYYSITTNGTLLDEEKINFLSKNKIFLMISLDGDKTVHDKNRVSFFGEPTFDIIMHNLEKIKEIDANYYKYYLIFSTTLTESCDYQQLDLFFSRLKKSCKVSGVLAYGSKNIRSLDKHSKNRKYIVDRFIEGCLRHRYDRIDDNDGYIFPLNVVGTIIKLIHKRRVSNNFLLEKNYLFKNHCIPGATKIFVSPEGNFFPCEKLDAHNHLMIGNINEGIKLKNIENMLNKFMSIKNKYCTNCPFLDICNLCLQSASDGEKFDTKKFELFCYYAKHDIENGLKIYSRILEKDENALNFLLLNQD